MTEGFVVFELTGQTFAAPLEDVREVMRLTGLQVLPGMQPPLAGVVVVRGSPMPVLDVRGPGAAPDTGDVLVVSLDDDVVGVAVDEVIAVVRADELPEAETAARVLPAYVVGVRQGREASPVLLVDLTLLLDVVADGWSSAARVTSAVAQT